MDLLLKRIALKSTYTIGKLYIDGEYFCDTLEDKDRGLTESMLSSELAERKVKGSTAIPTGTYKITLNIVSPKYSNYGKYSWSKEIKGKVPRLLNVPGYEGILIHPGNDSDDTDGCILVGQNKQVGKVINSVATFKKLYNLIEGEKDNLWITIKN